VKQYRVQQASQGATCQAVEKDGGVELQGTGAHIQTFLLSDVMPVAQ